MRHALIPQPDLNLAGPVAEYLLNENLNASLPRADYGSCAEEKVFPFFSRVPIRIAAPALTAPPRKIRYECRRILPATRNSLTLQSKNPSPLAPILLFRDELKLTLLTPFNKNRAKWDSSVCINTRDGKHYRLDTLPQASVITLGDILCGYLMHPEIKSLGPDGAKCKPIRGEISSKASTIAFTTTADGWLRMKA
jgi:hypothetical protein